MKWLMSGVAALLGAAVQQQVPAPQAQDHAGRDEAGRHAHQRGHPHLRRQAGPVHHLVHIRRT
jgi:hypothetical protein